MSTEQRTWRVSITSGKTRVFEVIAADEAAAEDAVYWHRSAGHPTANVREISSHSGKQEIVVKPTTVNDLCACGHWYEHHGEHGCGWSTCSCTVSH